MYIEDEEIASSLSPDLAKKLLGWVRGRQLMLLADSEALWDPVQHGIHERRCLRQVAGMFKKNASFTSENDLEAATAEAFWAAEKRCRIANKRIAFYDQHPGRLDPELLAQLERMKRFIESTLGPFSTFLEGLPKRIRVTSGASASFARRDCTPRLKMSRRVECTRQAEPYIRALAGFYGFKAMRVKYVDHNRVTTVSKDWRKRRTIACEAEGNLALQLAFDDHAKEHLLKRGVNLRSQSKNQWLAKEASITGALATVDLAMASDSMAQYAVALLFPYEWFDYLTSCRAALGLYNGETFRYAKFSSMGNGSTFTVETLVFAAACHALRAGKWSVYGDDIIIDSHLTQPLERLLGFLGFKLNREKSFSQGPFRESCGEDYYDGKLITPFYWRDNTARKDELCHNINGLARIATPDGKLENYLLQLVKAEKLQLVPFNGDTRSGIFVDVPTAYSLGLISRQYSTKGSPSEKKRVTGDWIPSFKGYTPKMRGFGKPPEQPSDNASLAKLLRYVYYWEGMRGPTYLLWHLNKMRLPDREVDLSGAREPVIGRYARAKVNWYPMPIPTGWYHLYRWSDRLAA
jgi:hypothetical protein